MALWSQLHHDCLGNIIKLLDVQLDVVSFGQVCKRWHRVALGIHMGLHCKLPMHLFVPKSSPLPMLLHPDCDGPGTHQLYSLKEQKMYGDFHLQELSGKWIVGSGAGWVVTVDSTDPEVSLLNPLTGKKIPLPHLCTLPSCDLSSDVDDPTAYWYLRKVIVCSYQGSILVVALVSEHKTIRFCKIGDPRWTRLEHSPLYIDDIIIHNGKLYAVNQHGALFEIDIADPGNTTVVAKLRIRPKRFKHFLVSFSDALILLARELKVSVSLKGESQRTSRIDVFRLEGKVHEIDAFEYQTETGMQYPEKVGHSWVELENLGDYMVFVGYNHSLCLDSKLYPSCKGNLIYFADYRYERDDHHKMRDLRKKLYHDVGVFHMTEGWVQHFQNFSNASSPMNMVWLSPSFTPDLEMQMLPQ